MSRGTPTAITIGNFDGVHVGHAALVRACRSAVGERGRVVAMAFDPHPGSTLAPGKEPARLTSFERRSAILKELGANAVIRLAPTPAFLGMTPEEFIDSVVMPHKPTLIVEGDDFHFGRARAGTPAVLAGLGRSRGFETRFVGGIEVGLSDQLVVRASSTVVRWLIAQGRMKDAGIVLGRPYVIDGTVTRGDRRGRVIGFPTANVATDQLLPADGVYAGTISCPDGVVYPAAINVGERPTFKGVGRRLEVFGMNTDGSAASIGFEYDWATEVSIEGWVRDDLKFDSVDGLVAQIRRDVRVCVGRAVGAAGG